MTTKQVRDLADSTACRQRALSFGQEGIALQQEAAGASPIFNVPAALDLRGPLDRDALARSLSGIVRRHDVLRSTFGQRAGAHVQLVHPPHPVDLPVHDLRGVPTDQREAAARAYLNVQSAAPFDLEQEPGLRCLLIALEHDRHILFWNMHHIVCDGWSKSIFARELSAHYAAYVAGGIPALPAIGVDYGDFVTWQRQIGPEVLGAQQAYWDAQLEGVEDVPGVATDWPHTPRPIISGEDVEFTAGVAVQRGLAELAQRSGVTMYMALQTALACLLHRVSGQRDVVVCVPYGLRPSTEFESLIGFFVNVLAIRVNLAGDPPFQDLLRQVRGTALDAYDHHQIPFQRVVEQVAARGGGRLGALNQVSLAFQNLPYDNVELVGITAERFALTRVDIRYELELHMWEDSLAGGLGGRLIYRPDLFHRQTVGDMLKAWHLVLESIVADPDIRPSQIPLPTEALVGSRPPPATAAGCGPDTPVAPRSATELAVYDIWVDLLHFEDIGVHDRFLDIGGHSLLVALMVARIRATLGVDVAIGAVFRHPTIEGIAAAIDAAGASTGPADG